MGYRSPNERIIVAAPVAKLTGTLETGVSSIGFAGLNTVRPFRIASLGGRCSLGLSGKAVNKKIAPHKGVCTVGFVLTRLVPTPEPGPFTHQTVVRTYDLADGEAATGTVYFTPSAWLLNSAVTIVAARVAAKLDGTGSISVHLAANTNPGTFPGASYYTVREAIDGQPERSYRVKVPHDAISPVNLTSLPVIP